MTIRIITNRTLLHPFPEGGELLVGRRFCFVGRSYGRLFIGHPKVWGPMEDVIGA